METFAQIGRRVVGAKRNRELQYFERKHNMLMISFCKNNNFSVAAKIKRE